MLAVIDNFDSEFSSNPRLQRLIRTLHRKIYRSVLGRLPAGTVVVGPWPSPENRTANQSLSFTHFADLFQNLALRDREIPEFMELTEQITSILASVGGNQERQTAYALSAPHTESLPFKILALDQLLQAHQHVHLVRPFGLHGKIIRAISKKRDVRLTTGFSSWALLLSLIVSWQKKVSLWKERMSLLAGSLRAIWLRKPVSTKDAGVLFLANRERSSRYLEPVMNELREKGQTGSLVSGIRGAHENREIIFLSDFMRLGEPLKAFRHTSRVWARARAKIQGISVEYHGVNLASVYFPQIQRIYLTKGYLVNLYAGPSVRLISALRPPALFSSDPAELSSALFAAARATQVPTVLYACMDNGLPSSAQVWRANLIADRVLTLNDHLQNYLARTAGGKSKFRMVGDVLISPPFSNERKQEILHGLSAALGLRLQKPMVLLLSRHVSEALTLLNKELLFRSAVAVCGELDAQLVVKCHPHEDAESTRREMNSWNIQAPIVPGSFPYTLREMSAVARLVCNFPGSSSSIEAMIENTPVLVIGTPLQVEQYNAVENAAAFVRFGAVAWARGPAEAVSSAKLILDNDQLRQEQLAKAAAFLLRFQGFTDGLSSRRIADEVIAAIGTT